MAGIYRIAEDQVAGALRALAESGGTVRTEESWRQDRMTALVLGTAPPGGGGGGGALLPISQRTLSLGAAARNVAGGLGGGLAAGWISSNQFSARMGTRRQSRATVGAWAELLPELDLLVAVHREDTSLVGRWYAQTGFHGVMAMRCLYLEMDAPPASVPGRLLMRLIGPEQVAAWAPQMAAVHHDVFGNYGGTVRRFAAPDTPSGGERGSNYWGPALTAHFYKDHYQFQILGLWSGPSSYALPQNSSRPEAAASISGEPVGTLMGYAIVGWSGWHSKRPRMDILELATRQWDRGVAEELIATTCQLAWSKQVREVRAVLSVHDPYRPHLIHTGFDDRWGYVMVAKWLQAQRYLDRLAAGWAAGVPGVRFQISVPGQVDLNLPMGADAAGGGERIVRLQMNEATATRLLLGRLELPAALREGQVLALGGREGDLARLAAVLPWTPWIFHMVDYI